VAVKTCKEAILVCTSSTGKNWLPWQWTKGGKNMI